MSILIACLAYVVVGIVMLGFSEERRRDVYDLIHERDWGLTVIIAGLVIVVLVWPIGLYSIVRHFWRR